MLIPELEKILRQMEIRPSRKSLTNKSGFIHSPSSGRGMDFKEVRNYIYGDDTRHIDWNVSSRMGDLYVKEFHKENDRIVNIFLDLSYSMFVDGSTGRNKYHVGFQVALFLALVSQFSGDRIQIICYSEGLVFSSGIIKIKDAIYYAFKKIQSLEFKKSDSNHSFPFEYLKNKASRKSISFIISDFYNLPELDSLTSLFRVHDIYGIQVFDPIEVEGIELFRLLYVKEPESNRGGKLNITAGKDLKILETLFSRRLLRLRTDQDLGVSLLEFLKK
ncbi:MAG: DUF58 domain-containing protein [Leptospiraceae bacterium]|nr:DUF58 domain-containing protein [Leptospiraceae bacterium]MCP5510874.1 DUF58 domain-containing protein [Leptospiraceae bacterium]